ncbi:MAG: fluoride efflux transporter FluC [Rhodoglobus sp.]
MTAAVVFAILGAGAVGAVLRYLTARAFSSQQGFPWAVLTVNVVGSALGGMLAGMAHIGTIDPNLEVVLLTGLCGGLTTFSTLSVETMQIVTMKRLRVALLSVTANLVAGIGAAATTYFWVIALAN